MVDQLWTLRYALDTLCEVVCGLDDGQMEVTTACAPWTVRQVASHALNSQLMWVGFLSGSAVVSVEDTMSAVPYPGELGPLARDVRARTIDAWQKPDALSARHATAFGPIVGSEGISFPTVDALAHAFDISVALGGAIEFTPEAIAGIDAAVAAVCTQSTRAMGLFGPAQDTPADATSTERLLARTGRVVARSSG